MMRLNGGILTESGVYFVLCETPECDEDEAVICAGKPVGSNLSLRRISEPREFVSLKPLDRDWGGDDAAALTAQGEFCLLSATGSTRQFIPGAGFGCSDSSDLGRMTMLKQIGPEIFALGYGGQVYRRTSATGWNSNHVSGDVVGSGLNVCIYDVVKGPCGVLYFGGVDISKFQRTAEIINADADDDEERWLELLLSSPSGDRMGLRFYDGSWHMIDIEYQGAIAVILETRAGLWTVFSTYGVAWQTEDFSSFDEVIALGGGKKFWDIKQISGNTYVIVGQQLMQLTDGALVPFIPALPRQLDGYTNVAGNSTTLAAFHEEGVVQLSGRTWTRLAVTLAP